MKNTTYHMNNCFSKYFFILCFLLTCVFPAFNQETIEVSGKILGARNVPVKDVSVSAEGLSLAPALTDHDGVFTIQVQSGNVWLLINPVGKYKKQRIFLNNRREIIIFLTETDMRSGFDEIQVINKVEKRRDLITSYSDIEIDRIERNNFITIDQAFQGVVPGLYTVNHSGMPGQGAVSNLRGIASMNTTNAPLFIIDGMPIEKPGLFISSINGNYDNPLSSLEPSDISGVTILKDPVATAIYGTKASNGIVLIETLEAKAIQTTIGISLKTGLNLAPNNLIPQLNAQQYKLLANEILMSSPKKPEDFKDDYPGLYVNQGDKLFYRYMHNTNWQNYIFSNSMFNKAYLSIRGGSEMARYGLSIGYHDQEGIINNTSYNRYNFGFISDFNVFAWLKLKVNTNLTNHNAYLKESSLSPQTNPIITSLSKPPLFSPFKYDDEGQKLTILDEVDELGTSNPLAVIENFIGQSKGYRFISSVRGHADINNSLKMNTIFGLNLNTMKEFVFKPNHGMEKYYEGEIYNTSKAANNYLMSYYSDNYFNYNKEFNTLHEIFTSLGFRISGNKIEADFGEGFNLPENDEYTNLQSGQNTLKNIGGYNDTWNWLSVYHQLTYKFKDRYILNSGLSADFSTRTGKNAKTSFKINEYPFGLFYSIGAGWRISEESIFSKIRGLDNLILRVSYGITGNDDIGSFSAINYYMPSLYRETSGLIPGVIVDKSLKYEQISQLNAGVDLSIRGDRTRSSLNYFIKTTHDMLINEPLESYFGYSFRPANLGDVENRGWEMSFFQRIIDGHKFKWDFSSALTYLTNEVKYLNNEELITRFEGGQYITREGHPVNSFYGFKFDGVYSTQNEADSANLVNAKGIPFGAGDVIYRDISGPENKPDGIINDFDKVILGSPNPEYFGSISNNLRYNRWSFNILVNFVYGNEIFNYTRYLNERMVDLSNQSTHVLNRWQFQGDETNIPRALWNDPVGNSEFSNRWIENGSYLRLKALTLRYTIPQTFFVFKNADFFITATNIFTLSNYLGYDPELIYSSDPMHQGIDYGLMPQSRQYILGVKIGL